MRSAYLSMEICTQKAITLRNFYVTQPFDWKLPPVDWARSKLSFGTFTMGVRTTGMLRNSGEFLDVRNR